MKAQRSGHSYLLIGFAAALALDRAVPAASGGPTDAPLAIRELQILGPDGKAVLRLGASPDGGVIEIHDASGATSLTLAGNAQGGRLAVLAPDGSRCAYLGCADKSAAGTLLLSQGKKPGLEAGIGEDGGYVRMINVIGKSAAFVGVVEGGGGVVEAHSAEGAVVAQLASGEGGGHLDIRTVGGETLAVLTAPKEGNSGLLRILTREGDPAVELGATDLGGQIDVLGRKAKALAVLKASDMGGQLLLNCADGPVGAFVGAFKDGGQLALSNHQGVRIVEATGAILGGEVTLRTREGKDAVKLLVTANGGQTQAIDGRGKATSLPSK